MFDEAVDVSGQEKARRRSEDQTVENSGVLRGSAVSAAAAVATLPWIWASEPSQLVKKKRVVPEVAFYRKYTEALLRRYVRLSMEAGRVPSLLGQEMFRGKVTSYRVAAFDDVVIFVHDIEKCLETLAKGQQALIQRIALEEFTQVEVAERMGVSERSVVRRYSEALDLLTRLFLERKMLEPQLLVKG